MYMYTYLYTYVCISICLSLSLHLFIYIYIYIYIHTVPRVRRLGPRQPAQGRSGRLLAQPAVHVRLTSTDTVCTGVYTHYIYIYTHIYTHYTHVPSLQSITLTDTDIDNIQTNSFRI